MDQSAHEIAANALLSRLGTHLLPQIVDVCLAEDIDAHPWRIPTARHVPHDQIRAYASRVSVDQPVVVICQKGLKLSHRAAAILRSMGCDAYALAGGNLAWFGADRPRLELARAPAVGTPWVLAAQRDRCAMLAAWVIRRWYDAQAPLFWVGPEHVNEVASRFDGCALPPDSPLAQRFAACGLDHPALCSWIDAVETGTASASTLLDVLPNLHTTDEELVQGALPILDAAWVAFCSDTSQEAAQ